MLLIPIYHLFGSNFWKHNFFEPTPKEVMKNIRVGFFFFQKFEI